jgi:hypothetical protein
MNLSAVKRIRTITYILPLFLAACASTPSAQPIDPLPAWNEGPLKQSILAFVSDVTDRVNDDFVPIEERVAVFDNDDALWSEKPAYSRFLFVLDRVRALAPEHPEWQSQQPYKAVLENDMQALAQGWTVVDIARDWGVVFPATD